MYLKFFPKDADIGALAEIAMNMTQTALLRAYEVIEIEKRPLNFDEQQALDAMVALFGTAKKDVRKFKKRSAH